MKIYGEYVSNFKNALDTLHRCQEQDPKFAQFLEKAGENNIGLLGLMSAPLNHITSCRMLLQVFLSLSHFFRNLPNQQNLLQLIIQILFLQKKTIKRTSLIIQSSLEGAENRAKLNEIQRRSFYLKFFFKFNSKAIKPGRSYVGEGEIIVIDTKQKPHNRYYFLFSDVLWVTKYNPKSADSKYKLRNEISLAKKEIKSLPNSTTTRLKKTLLILFLGQTVELLNTAIVPPTKYILSFSNDSTKSTFLENIHHTLGRSNIKNRGLKLFYLCISFWGFFIFDFRTRETEIWDSNCFGKSC